MRSLLYALVLSVLILFFSVSPLAVALGKDGAMPAQDREMLTFRYAEFVGAFRGKNWNHVCTFVTDETKAGFGPGQMGCAGVKAVFAENEQCWEDMLFALRQGCRISRSAEACSSPPQLSDEVAHLGARAFFSYNKEDDLLKANSLICGGD